MNNKFSEFIHRQLDGKYGEFLRYSVVGTVTTAINFSVYYALYRLFRVPITISNAVAVVCANVYSYFGNKRHAFRTHCENKKALYKELTLFFSSRIGTIALETAGVPVVVRVTHEPPMLAKIEVVVIVVIINYIVSKFVVFHTNSRSKDKE